VSYRRKGPRSYAEIVARRADVERLRDDLAKALGKTGAWYIAERDELRKEVERLRATLMRIGLPGKSICYCRNGHEKAEEDPRCAGVEIGGCRDSVSPTMDAVEQVASASEATVPPAPSVHLLAFPARHTVEGQPETTGPGIRADNLSRGNGDE
jgi:hypothetical protein